MIVTVEIPLRVTNASNGSHGHWAMRAKKRAADRRSVALFTRSVTPPPLPCVVTLVRLAPRPLDSDGLRTAMKSVRDQVAIWLGLQVNAKGHAEDADPRVFWAYMQGRGKPREYGVLIVAEGAEQHIVDAKRNAETWRAA